LILKTGMNGRFSFLSSILQIVIDAINVEIQKSALSPNANIYKVEIDKDC